MSRPERGRLAACWPRCARLWAAEAAFAKRQQRCGDSSWQVTLPGTALMAELLGIAVPPAKTSISARAGNAPAVKAAKGCFFFNSEAL